MTLNAGRPTAPVVVSGCAAERPVRSDAVFQAASLTKPAVAFAALTLVREGAVDLRAPVSHYLPKGYVHRKKPFGDAKSHEVDLVPASTLARIPVATLLNHSSGLPNWTSGELAPTFVPGRRWQYSGEGYALSQAVMGAVTGQDIESFMTRRVFEPLGMRHTRLRLTQDIREHGAGRSSRAVNGSRRAWRVQVSHAWLKA